MFKEYKEYDALGLSELLKKKEVSAKELLEEAIFLTETLDPLINAVPQKHFELAKAQAETDLKGPFFGVPFLLKDLHSSLEGTITSDGSRSSAKNVADFTDTLTQRCLDSGLVIFGKTNSPEFGLTVTTEPVLFGPTRNPWNLNHSAGGSSGGAAAAVAAGIIPMAQATDGGGSIRIPASCCGLVGLKPTRARTPRGPKVFEGWAGQSIAHCVSISVRDSALLLDATSGPEIGSPYHAPYQKDSFLSSLEKDPKNLKIAYIVPESISIDAEVKDVMTKTFSLLESLGHSVESKSIDLPTDEIMTTIAAVISSSLANKIDEMEKQIGKNLDNTMLENVTLQMQKNGKEVLAKDYIQAVKTNHKIGYEVEKMFLDYDILLSPVLAKPPVEIGNIDLNTTDFVDYAEKLSTYTPFTGIFNQSGHPSISLPLYRTPKNLPVGTMLTASFGNEALLFGLARQLEVAEPWEAAIKEMRTQIG
jgi:amidase/6-aminohexanoate-cyclic-dimer hydrolase|tara:strand:- start:2168 stop:3595 length:1428 start_codon:yes stop_codon:yes gene_type:complete